MYNLIEYSEIYSKTSWTFRQCYRDETSLKNSAIIIDFPANNNNILLKFKEKK